MSISNPTQLVDAYKKSGEFDRLRRELLAEFQRGEGMSAFMARVDDIARKKLETDQRLQYMPAETVHRELQQELDRYPIVERAVADVRMLSDQSFISGIRDSVQRILREDRAKAPQTEKGEPQATPNRQPQSSIPEGPSAIRKALAMNSQQPESTVNSRSQSPDSMKMSTPEPPELPNAPSPNGIANNSKPDAS